jgi:hypothetical protein
MQSKRWRFHCIEPEFDHIPQSCELFCEGRWLLFVK